MRDRWFGHTPVPMQLKKNPGNKMFVAVRQKSLKFVKWCALFLKACLPFCWKQWHNICDFSGVITAGSNVMMTRWSDRGLQIKCWRRELRLRWHHTSTNTTNKRKSPLGSFPLTPSMGAGRALNSCLVKSKQWPCCDKGRRCWNAPLFSVRNPRTHCCRSPSGTGPETGLPALWKAG